MTIRILAAAALAATPVALAPAGSATAATVYNSSFEIPDAGSAADADGWVESHATVQRSDQAAGEYPSIGFEAGPTDGDWKMIVNGIATDKPFIRQLITDFVIGEGYDLLVDVGNHATNVGNDATDSFAIDVLSDDLGTTHFSSVFSAEDLGLEGETTVATTASLSFIAPATSLWIRFRTQVSSDRSYILDNVRFATSNVPLPAALPLLGAGLAGLGLMRRRRPA